MTTEKEHALRDAHEADCEKSYFEPRPCFSSSRASQYIFRDGFKRGWNAAMALRDQAEKDKS